MKKSITRLVTILMTSILALCGVVTGAVNADRNCLQNNSFFNGPVRDCMSGSRTTSHIKLGKKRIMLTEKVQFEVGSAALKSESTYLLDEVAELLLSKQGKSIESLRIEGHTSSDGDHDTNVSLSYNRATAVLRYLVSKGVDSSRLTSRGYGPDKPIASNATEKGRMKNRRVEMMILKRAGKTILEDINPYSSTSTMNNEMKEGMDKMDSAVKTTEASMNEVKEAMHK